MRVGDCLPYVESLHGAKLYYETVGQGTPILFVHPPAMGHVTFMKQRSLQKHFKLIYFDLRGNGRSSIGEAKISMDLLAYDIKTVLDELQIDRVVLFGYSNGGSICQHFALTYPERTKGLILSGPFPKVNSFLLKSEFRLGIIAMKMRAIDLLANVLGVAHFRSNEKWAIRQLRDYVKRSKPAIVRKMYQAGIKYDCSTRLHEITVPVLMLYGGLEFYIHHYWRDFVGKVKNLDVVFIDKAPHQIPTKFATECNYIVTKFIKEKIEVCK